MKLIVGLGNPGSKYNRTRHNVGFEVIDSIARQLAPGEPATSKFDAVVIEARANGEKVLLMKPQQFMNRSGQPIKQAISFYKADPTVDLLLVVDDIHLPCGSIRLKNNGTAGGHNGLTDVTNHLGGGEWARLRIGVDEPGLIPQSDYVLGKFTPDQQEIIEPALSHAVNAAITWIHSGIDEAMNIFNETQNSETTR
ncbi:MAG: aminoacyl-tRNA hydrolase [Phycisphaerales bacterium]|nr:aminoacyl-tRNA hydrolase [Planctomycetota bacterium]MBL6997652.1 aminoacyl-tRNA hydrolase [Phycisphaerales bacterium]